MQVLNPLNTLIYGLCSVICILGCSPSPETQAEQILQKDPSFVHVWEKKQLILSEIASFRAQFEGVKSDFDSKIGRLREELKGHENNFKQKSQVLQEKMRPEIEKLSQTTKNLEAQLKETQDQFRQVEKEASDLEKEIQHQTSQSTTASSDTTANASKDELAGQFSRKVVQREELKLQVKKLESEIRLRKQQARLLLSW